jgi:hypothetical protein
LCASKARNFSRIVGVGLSPVDKYKDISLFTLQHENMEKFWGWNVGD